MIETVAAQGGHCTNKLVAGNMTRNMDANMLSLVETTGTQMGDSLNFFVWKEASGFAFAHCSA